MSTLGVAESSQQVKDGPLLLNLAEHFEEHGADGGGGGLHNSRPVRRDDRTVVMFKEQHPRTNWLKEHGQKDD